MTTFNPLGFWCAPNGATPHYVTETYFERFVAYGFTACWLGTGFNDDPNDECYFDRPVTHEDVQELRKGFLSALETVIAGLWDGRLTPGDGLVDFDGSSPVVSFGDEQHLAWEVRLDADAILVNLHGFGSDLKIDDISFWLSYEALEDRQKVVEVLRRANEVTGEQVYDQLVLLAKESSSA